MINKNADRVNSYHVWNYAEGHDSYYAAMIVDLTLPPDQVSQFSGSYIYNFCLLYTSDAADE